MSRSNGRSVLLAAAVVAAAAVLVVPDPAGAIPAFARKYRMSCTTCHAPVPRLKPYGEDFAGSAFRLEDKEPKRFFPDTGDDLLTLQRELPVAVRFDGYASYDHGEDEKRSDFRMPYGIKLLSGGNVSEHVGYYFYFYLSERGEVAGVEDAYLHFNDLFGIDLDVMAGQFQVCDPLFKRELRLTYEDYVAYKIRVGDSPVNLAYDRGFMVTFGSDFGLDAVFEAVNGNGIGAAENERFDDDHIRNFMLRLSQSAGPARIGAFGYYGDTEMKKSAGPVSDVVYYWGIDGTLDVGERLQLNGQYLRRTDDNPYFQTSGAVECETIGGIAELIFAPQGDRSRHWFVLLYNYIDSQMPGLDYRSETVSYSLLLRRNLRLLAETTFSETDESWRITGGFVSAF
ncbi:MAG: hypothetical protein PHQ19_05165 [Candidatus Krumholzibacteria bacterium]|nr:hypothetical protein [Candidatus Krumholzibacteria bacterium]